MIVDTCVECDDEIPARRAALGFDTCIECASAHERVVAPPVKNTSLQSPTEKPAKYRWKDLRHLRKCDSCSKEIYFQEFLGKQRAMEADTGKMHICRWLKMKAEAAKR